MASSAPAVFAPTSFDDLRLGRSAQFFVARLVRFWDSRNIKKQGEFSFGSDCSVSTKIRHISLKISSAYFIPFTIIYRNVEGYLSLLDEAAARFKGLLNSGETTNSVMVITSLNPQKRR
ncbi:hypothetical protein F2Q70_00006740 [Brassica cretica]|uniref:Uncharacterized protein n=1 Tax=Brassica cretica TaxID=69181 RepID=A0A8S9IWQ3_BRACR|nr:hypothetical protein F2Q70_00006740 [Brassica cretica]